MGEGEAKKGASGGYLALRKSYLYPEQVWKERNKN